MGKPRYHWWNSPGFRDDDGSLQWSDVLRHFRSICHLAVWRIDNRWQDLRAIAVGACNRSTWTGQGFTGYAGGYSHWRCGKRRGHPGPHRFINYTWSGRPDDRVQYNPLPVLTPDNAGFYSARYDLPFMKYAGGRHAVDRRSRSRQQAALEEAYLQRRRI